MTAGGAVDAPLGRHPVHRTRMAVTHGGRAAVTHYRVLARFAAHSFLAVRLETGRTHQIRVHMAHLGFPILGDPAYGGRPRVPAGAGPELLGALRGFRRQALHACAHTLSAPGERRMAAVQRAAAAGHARTARRRSPAREAAAARVEALAWPATSN